MKRSGNSRVYVLAIAAAAVPFAFALIRAVTTGKDYRYFWLAIAGLAGTAATVTVGRTWSSPVLTAAVFVIATLLTVLAALAIGTRLGPGILVVAAGFGFCFAVSALLNVLARRPD